MSLVAYADSDEDSSDNESSEAVSSSAVGQEHNASEEMHFAGPAALGQ